MTPIFFSCEETLPLAPDDIARQILDLDKWPEFQGYGPIPGIKTAVFDTQTPGMVGTRIHVINLDGSSHGDCRVATRPTCSAGVQGVLAAAIEVGDDV